MIYETAIVAEGGKLVFDERLGLEEVFYLLLQLGLATQIPEPRYRGMDGDILYSWDVDGGTLWPPEEYPDEGEEPVWTFQGEWKGFDGEISARRLDAWGGGWRIDPRDLRGYMEAV